VEFVETRLFTKRLPDYLGDDAYLALQLHLASNPQAGEVIPGTGGFRKIRWVDQRRGKGKRGGLRIVYYYFLDNALIWLMTLYDKDEAADLSFKHKQLLKGAIEEELRERERRRRSH
jgi:hypothetical protein